MVLFQQHLEGHNQDCNCFTKYTQYKGYEPPFDKENKEFEPNSKEAFNFQVAQKSIPPPV